MLYYYLYITTKHTTIIKPNLLKHIQVVHVIFTNCNQSWGPCRGGTSRPGRIWAVQGTFGAGGRWPRWETKREWMAMGWPLLAGFNMFQHCFQRFQGWWVLMFSGIFHYEGIVYINLCSLLNLMSSFWLVFCVYVHRQKVRVLIPADFDMFWMGGCFWVDRPDSQS